ncbi:type II toxin-antitoxin system VapC family toxin [Rhizobium sp. TH2]|uniref:PIN domain-containing protein n=1 Tax=Rhizobium sp. TH2 TaxID=2775403 RepID=UPI00215889A0|nr:type II toxin-antitoxin system VapC family toxin [Rhizobium sp. TH2]UVC07640.1 type II toxin-antitoxin system VapC family toxin [Rhizobium sp. TH2]
MIGIDTNVLVRFLVDDDKRQNEKARAFLSARTIENPAFLSAVALAETVWVLHRRLEYPMSDIVAMLRALLAADSLFVEHTEELDALINGDDEPAGDLADHLIAWSGAKAGCSMTVTFDRGAAKTVSGMELLQ